MSVALRGLAGRKLRATLTALAIVLGVAMMSGTYILTDTINKAFDEIFVESYAGTDAVVSGKSTGISSDDGGEEEAPPVPANLVDDVRRAPGVAVATGTLFSEGARLVKRDGKAIDTGGAPSLGFGIDTAPQYSRFNPLKLVEGTWPSGNEVVIDVGTADDQKYAVGDTIGFSAEGPVAKLRISGIAKYGSVNSIGSATFAVLDVPTAQRLFRKPGKFDAIQVAAAEGVGERELLANLRRAVPASVEVKSGVQQADEDSEEVAEFTKFIQYFLLAFAGIAIFVGAFVIFNTLSITVAQRTREFATLRTIGASRRQVLGSVIVEALVIGLLASLVGLGLGYVLAIGLDAVFTALGADLPQTDMVFATRTVVVALLVGVIVTLVAGLTPALRATRVPPIAAVREGATLPPSRIAPFTPYIAVVVTALAVALLAYSLFVDDVGTAERLLAMGGGVLLLFAGIAMLSSRLVRPLVALVGWPATKIGGAAGRLAQGNSTRNPGRTAATAAALMIGIALVTFVAVFVEGLKRSNTEAIERQIAADYVVTSQDGFTPFVAAAGDALAEAEGIELATDVRSERAEISGSDQYLTGIESVEIGAVYRFDWKNGDSLALSQLGDDGALVSDDFADEKNLEVGSRLRIRSTDNRTREVVVRGIYEPPPFYPLLGAVSVEKSVFDELHERPRNQFTLINVPGEPRRATKRALELAAADFPDAKVQTRGQWIDDQEAEINNFVMLLYVLLALSVIVSLFGMVNTLVLTVFERTRELGMLRAVGMTRRQVRRMVRHESVITALIGAALGLPLGIFLAALVTQALSQFDLQFAVPVPNLLVFAVVAITAGILAAILPARRASRLRILEALQYE